MDTLLALIIEFKNVLEAAKSIPHTKETFSQRRDVLRKCNELRGKIDEWMKDFSVLDVLGVDVGFSCEEAIDEFYPTPRAVEKTVEEYGRELGNMLFSMDNIIKAAEKHDMGESLRKRMESAEKLLSIVTDYFEDSTDKY